MVKAALSINGSTNRLTVKPTRRFGYGSLIYKTGSSQFQYYTKPVNYGFLVLKLGFGYWRLVSDDIAGRIL